MNLYFRVLSAMLQVLWRPRVGPFDEVTVSFRTWPNDLDFNGHMNNGRYLTLMDLGRLALMVRVGVAREALRQRWAPVLGAAQIAFRRPLKPFQRFELKTRILGWDEKWIYLEQRFESDGKLYADATVQALFQKGRDKVLPSELVRLLGLAIQSPPLPAHAVRRHEPSKNP